MKDAEKIARDCAMSQCGSDDLCAVLDEKSCGCMALIATALRAAHAAGYAEAREQAAGVADREAGCFSGSRDLYTIHREEARTSAAQDIAAAILAMEPEA